MTALNKASLFNTAVFRLALVTVAIFAITAVALVRYIFPATNDMLTAQVLQTIAAEATGLREQFASGGMEQLTRVLRQRTDASGSSLYYLESRQGRKLAGNLNRLPPEITSSVEGGVFGYSRAKRSAPAQGETGGRVQSTNPNNQPNSGDRLAGVRLAGDRLAAGIVITVPGGAHLVVARDIEKQRDFARRVKWALYGGFGLLLLIGLGGGLLVSRLTLRRIETVTKTSHEIMAGDLSRRIPLSGSGDELDRLSGNLNDMLERIEQLMAGLREVSDNIAHDLKTPLNRLRNRAEAALRDTGGASAYRDGLESTIEEADDLIKTFNALLSIARLDAGAAVEDMEVILLSTVVSDVGELYDPLADEQGFHFALQVADGLKISGNRQLIGQALANLIDNAIKYAGSGQTPVGPVPGGSRSQGSTDTVESDVAVSRQMAKGAIELSLQRTGSPGEEGMARIIVADNGPGIPDNLRARALTRFARLDESRSRPGSGLGLSLVSAVVRLHGGSLQLENNRPGLRVVIDLPLALNSNGATNQSRMADATN